MTDPHQIEVMAASMLHDNIESRSHVEEAEQRLDDLIQKCSTFSNLVEKLKSIHEQKSFDWRSMYLEEIRPSGFSSRSAFVHSSGKSSKNIIKQHEHELKAITAEITRKTDQLKHILSEDDLLNFKINLAKEVQRRIDGNLTHLLDRIQKQIDAKTEENAKLTSKVGCLKDQTKWCNTYREMTRKLRFECSELLDQLECTTRQALGGEQVLMGMQRQAQYAQQEENVLKNELQRRLKRSNAAQQIRDQFQAHLAARSPKKMSPPQNPKRKPPPKNNLSEVMKLKHELKKSTRKDAITKKSAKRALKAPSVAVHLDGRSLRLIRNALSSSFAQPLGAEQLKPLVQQMLASFLNEHLLQQLFSTPAVKEMFGGRRGATLRNSIINVHLDSVQPVTVPIPCVD